MESRKYLKRFIEKNWGRTKSYPGKYRSMNLADGE